MNQSSLRPYQIKELFHLVAFLLPSRLPVDMSLLTDFQQRVLPVRDKLYRFALRMLGSDENRQASDQVNNLTDLRSISTDEEKGMINPADIRRIKREITHSDYEELIVIYNYPSTVRLMALEKRDVIRELVLFADEPGKFTLINFKGKINLRHMGEAGHNIQVKGKNYWKELASK